jgi:hypothetical protein
MPSSDLIRWGGLAAMLAGVAFILDILFVLTMPEADWTNAVYIVAELLMVVGLLGLHALQKDNYGRIGRLLDGRRCVFCPSVGLNSFPVGKRSPHLARVPGGLRGRARRAYTIRRCYLAGESATTLVRLGTHHRPAGNGSLGRLRGDTVRSNVAGAGLRALVVEG